jgi:hypothetical protein
VEGLAWAGAPPAAAVLAVVVLGLNNLRSEAVLGVLVLFAPPVLQTDAARYGLLFVGFAVATQGRNAMSCRSPL